MGGKGDQMKTLLIASALLLLPASDGFAGDLVDAAQQAEAAVDAGNFAAALASLNMARDGVWNASPLTVTKAILVASDPQGYGIYDIRDNNQYKAGEPIVIYAEPAGFAYGRDGDMNLINMALDFEIKSSTGESLAVKQDFAKWELRSRVANKEFMGKLTYTFSGIEPGDYVVETTIRDQNSDKKVTFATPFKIVE
jgi:hypothetical protein